MYHLILLRLHLLYLFVSLCSSSIDLVLSLLLCEDWCSSDLCVVFHPE